MVSQKAATDVHHSLLSDYLEIIDFWTFRLLVTREPEEPLTQGTEGSGGSLGWQGRAWIPIQEQGIIGLGMVTERLQSFSFLHHARFRPLWSDHRCNDLEAVYKRISAVP